MTLENNFDRGDENGADRVGLVLANKAGYSPAGMAAFLTRLAERNKGLKERSGMFASHPEMKARLDDLAKYIIVPEAHGHRDRRRALYAVDRFQAGAGRSDRAGRAADTVGCRRPSPRRNRAAGGKFGLGGLNPLGREKSGRRRSPRPDRAASTRIATPRAARTRRSSS